jgi:ribosomal protein S18 acetylase RimI-like enzyme
MSIEIKKMSGSNGITKNDVAGVFVEGYYNLLSSLCKDKNKLINAFENAVNENVFYIALDGDKPVGITACANNKGRALHLDKNNLKKNLGFIKGSMAYSFMKNEFNTPLAYPTNTAYIECVATIPEARGKGVATEMMKYILNEQLYDEYILEVADTNHTAKKIYEKLGFKEFERKKEKFAKIKGVNYRIYMKINKEQV